MIRRSIRCFAFGLAGAVPLFGLGTAFLALRLQRELARETGVPARAALMDGSAVVAFALMLMSLLYDQAGFALALGFLLCAVQGYLLLRQYRRTEPADWNPARHLVYWGAALARTGLILSATIILAGVWAAIRDN
jgi:hypothetical protein